MHYQLDKCSELYEEELDDTSHQYQHEFDQLCEKFKRTKWFIRSERVSLKYGQHGAGPYSDIKSIVSARIGHEVFDNTDYRLYVIPWVEMQ